MNKKLKRMIATVSAVSVCAVSMVSVSAGAVYTSTKVTPYTTSFSAILYDKPIKFNLWQEATDYFDNEKLKVYISEPVDYVWHGEEEFKYLIGTKVYYLMGSYRNVWKEGDPSKWYDFCEVCPLTYDGYVLDNEDDVAILEKYLSDNNINYDKYINKIYTELPDGMQTRIDIKENTGFVCNFLLDESAVQVTDVENELPEPTLAGDANEDGVVNISDAVLIMQSITNPNEYKLTIQGIANADVVGDDGVTLLDALMIQEMEAGL